MDLGPKAGLEIDLQKSKAYQALGYLEDKLIVAPRPSAAGLGLGAEGWFVNWKSKAYHGVGLLIELLPLILRGLVLDLGPKGLIGLKDVRWEVKGFCEIYVYIYIILCCQHLLRVPLSIF